jgi:hypothetical protein
LSDETFTRWFLASLLESLYFYDEQPAYERLEPIGRSGDQVYEDS